MTSLIEQVFSVPLSLNNHAIKDIHHPLYMYIVYMHAIKRAIYAHFTYYYQFYYYLQYFYYYYYYTGLHKNQGKHKNTRLYLIGGAGFKSEVRF